MNKPPRILDELRKELDGEVLTDPISRALYATDASPYQQLPIGVVRPFHRQDCVSIMRFAARHRISLIPRGAGTSLAGQCVGEGLVVDIARHLNAIVHVDVAKRLARVQPGVVLADLNDVLSARGLMFPPDPSTATRCSIGGMVGNNAWGVHAVRYGTTRDYVEAIDAVLSDGSLARFTPLDEAGLQQKLTLDTLEGGIYRTLSLLVSRNLTRINERYPSVRGIPTNAGYPLDVLANSQPADPAGPPFNLARFLCGTEGTLALACEITLRLLPLPAHCTLVCAQFHELDEALQGVGIAMQESPSAVELLDGEILELTRWNLEQRRNRFWIEGEPQAVLLTEFQGDSRVELDRRSQDLTGRYRGAGLGYAYAVLHPPDVDRVWELRRAALGLLMGMPGERKAVTGIEDTAVAVSDLPTYLREVRALMERHRIRFVTYGSVSMGMLHIRPELDLKRAQDRATYETLLSEIASKVSRFNGAVSAKHGDGRLRASLLERMFGTHIVSLLREVKLAFDPSGLLNPGKILEAPPVTEHLRATAGHGDGKIKTNFDWRETQGFLGAAEKCNGAGNCLKSAPRGTMCPSYMVTREERHGTRGRANLFRQVLAIPHSRSGLTEDDLREVLDLCLSCKGCKSECPANVDIARMKAEFLQQYYDQKGTPWRTRFIGEFYRLSRIGSRAPRLVSRLLRHPRIKHMLGLHTRRPLPELAHQRFSSWFKRHQPDPMAGSAGALVLLDDPFTEFYEPQIGIAAVEVLERCGFKVRLSPCLSSGRVQISQGLLRRARATVREAIGELYTYAKKGLSIVGLEPSELLTFRDEAIDLLHDDAARSKGRLVAKQCLLFEEFLLAQAEAGRLDRAVFDDLPRWILLHGHCHQKALVGIQPSVDALKMIPKTSVDVIPSGCCGMAGAFGYEAEHYELSRQIGELVLFPAVREAKPGTVIVATGTSCRHQISDETGVYALHPAELIRAALR
ncbi:MAG: FAD-binding protein [Gammaproteobacteria bacterium]|nr:FAD-binding protein [Gammaproteobacteria bacterium]MCI0590967.1 FAD-binding protein [Gammaproteobacteria bacterium]